MSPDNDKTKMADLAYCHNLNCTITQPEQGKSRGGMGGRHVYASSYTLSACIKHILRENLAVKDVKFLPRCARNESQTPKAPVSLLRSATSLARLAAECSANSPAVRKEFALDERFI